MKILGMGIPEMIIVMLVIGFYALAVFIFYLVIKKAVKNGILEAQAQNMKDAAMPSVPSGYMPPPYQAQNMNGGERPPV